MLAVATACLPLYALNPAYTLAQYGHTVWGNDSGLQAVRRLKQTPEGYLWLATRGGLVRFDGIRFSSYTALSEQGLESSTIQDLVVDPDGSLWIASFGGGIAHLQAGKFTSYTSRDGLPSDDIQSLYRDPRGVLWIGTRGSGIARMVQGRFEQVPLAIPPSPITAFLQDANQSLWISSYGFGVFRLHNGVLTSFSTNDGLPDSRVTGLCRDHAGRIWTAGFNGISYWNGARFVEHPGLKAVGEGIACTEDRDGNLWVGSSSGLYRVQGNTVTNMDRSSGLSGDFVSDVFEDSEGDLWVATRGGLDRLRNGPVRTFTTREGLIPDSGPVAADYRSGAWTFSSKQIAWVAENKISTWPLALPAGIVPISMLSQPDGSLLLGFDKVASRWRRDGAAAIVPELTGLDLRSMLRARDGSLWAGTGKRGLIHWRSSGSQTSIETVLSDQFIYSLAEDRTGAIWAGNQTVGGLYRLAGGTVQRFGPRDGLRSPAIYSIFVDENGDVWIGSASGLSWFRDGQFHTVSSREGLPYDQVFAVLDDSFGRVWFASFGGIAEIEKTSLFDWAAGRRRRLDPTIYRTGLQVARPTNYSAVRSADGHLWFSIAEGLTEVTPSDPATFRGPGFRVLTEEATIDGVVRSEPGRIRIPPGARSIEIRYTALTLSDPSAVHFRYRLGEADKDWIDAGARRTAFYGNLKPGAYAFRVSASAGGDRWVDSSPLVLEQLPYFYQTNWFILLVSLSVVSLALLMHRLHLRKAVDRVQAGFEERMNERTRIARDLHDTLLQSFQGVLLKFHAISFMLTDRPEVQEKLESAIERARAAITEGRDAVQGLRTSTLLNNDLADTISALGKELASNPGDHAPGLVVRVEGGSRDLVPLVRDEVCRITLEAMRNAFRRSEARQIEVEIRYTARQLRLRIRDDGKGIDAAVLAAGKRPGHYGVPGMYERAGLIGGKLTIWSELDSGAEVELIVPAAIAYGKSSAAPANGASRREKS
jgi:ligand-binding sensor domain-containing protein/signal transduction histidine kinase